MSEDTGMIPETPHVTAPSPTSTDFEEGSNSYFAPVTRAAAAKRMVSSTGDISTAKSQQNGSADPSQTRRGRSRTPEPLLRRRVTGGTTPAVISQKPSSTLKSVPQQKAVPIQKSKPLIPPGLANGFLSPASAAKSAQYYWRELSRSPSPLGLIPIHKSWRSLIHKHEVPRKALHVSIGFVSLYLYCAGCKRTQIYPPLLAAVVPITAVEYLRHNSADFNRLYVRVLGAFMRETEVNEKYNGVIFYMVGAAWALFAYPADVAVMSILLLSWCDTAASTFGRLYGRYTPRIRKGKSLAGSVAAAVVGVLAALVFYGYFVPRYGGYEDTFVYKGVLRLPVSFGVQSDGIKTEVLLTKWVALGVIGLVSGLIAAFSEVVDVWGIDDNLTIPVISGALLWAFFRVFQ